MADFSDIPGELLTQRFQGLQDRYQGVQDMFSDPNAAFRSRLGLPTEDETEEERRKRLAREAAAKSSPVKETRTIDPATGEVSLKVEGREQDLSAANPLTPTVVPPRPPAAPQFNFQPPAQAPTQPVAPPVAQTQMPQPQMQQPRPQPVAAPAVPTPLAPVAKPLGQPVMSDTGEIQGYETPQQMLGNMQQNLPVGTNPVTQRITPQGQAVAPVNPAAPASPMQTVPGAPVTATPLQQTVETPPPVMAPWQQELLDAQADKQKLYAYLANKEHPAEARAVADSLLKKQFAQEAGQAETEKMLLGFVKGEPKAQSDIIKKLKSKDEEGSYVKAYIFNRLGLTKLADEEQAKIAGPKFERVIVDGRSYLAETNSKGGITGAYDDAGKSVDNTTLARINSGAAKFGTHAFGFTGGSLTIPEGQPNAGQEYRQRTNAQTGQIENLITTGPDAGKLYTGSPGYEKRVTSQALIGQNQLIFDLQKKHGGNVLDALKEYESRKRVLTPEERRDFFDLYGSQNPTIQKPFIPGVTTPANPQQKMSLPSDSTSGAMTPAVYNPNQAGGMMQTRLTREELATPVETIKEQQEIQKDIAKRAGTGEVDIGIEGRKKIVDEASNVIAKAPDFYSQLKQIDEGIAATKKKNNLGTIGEGVLPGERFIGRNILSSEDARNTDKALNAVKIVSAQGMKVLGANPTDADRDYLTSNIPDETWADKDLREWLQTRREFVTNKIDTAKKQIKSGGRYIPEMPKEAPAEQNLSPAERARQEMERRRKKP